jgi:hypothetical protein
MAGINNLLVGEVRNVFERSYVKHADFLVSCMFANLGVYGMVKSMSKDDNVVDSYYEHCFYEINTSYIWDNLFDLSAVLRQSVLYTVTTTATPHIFTIDDRKLSKGLIKFKKDVSAFMGKYATFLANCELEGAEFYTVVNAAFSPFDASQYETLNKQASIEIKKIFHTHKNTIPKVVMYVLDDIQHLVDVRHIKGEYVCSPTDFAMFPQFPRFTKQTFHEEILKFTVSNITNIIAPLVTIYRQLIPFHVLSQMQWLLTINGEKDESTSSVADKLNQEAIDGVRVFTRFLGSHALSPLKQELQNIPMLISVSELVENDIFFGHYSFDQIGWLVLHVFKVVHDFHQRHVKLLVLSDILFCGLYDAVSKEYQSDVDFVSKLVISCEQELPILYEELGRYKVMNNIMHTVGDYLHAALKRVKRYERYLRNVSDTEELPKYIDMIFGDVCDNDGSPCTCAICLDDAKDKKDTWFELPCKHLFHVDCVSDLVALELQPRCPLCRECFE